MVILASEPDPMLKKKMYSKLLRDFRVCMVSIQELFIIKSQGSSGPPRPCLDFAEKIEVAAAAHSVLNWS